MKKENIKKPKKKIRLKRWVWVVIFLGVLLVLGGSTALFMHWHKDNNSIEKQLNKIDEIVKPEEMPSDDENAELVNPPEEEPIEPNEGEEVTNKKNDYWDYIKIPLINVDFTELVKLNSDTVAFLKVNGTNINYPVVQAADNEFYLDHAFDKSYNQAGWVFSDYRNRMDNLKDNTIIYAHGRQNTTMFGSLKNILKSNWYDNTDNHVIHLSTPTENTLWQVISIYMIPEETYYLTTAFGSTESKQKFLDTIMGRSQIDFGTTVNVNDKILTLSTCYNHTNRVVLHAKLIKKAPAA